MHLHALPAGEGQRFVAAIENAPVVPRKESGEVVAALLRLQEITDGANQGVAEPEDVVTLDVAIF